MFEGGPVLVPPLQQDKESRRPIAVDGGVLDTVAACPPLSIVERARLEELQGAGSASGSRPRWQRRARRSSSAQAKKLAARTGMSEQAAKQMIVRQCEGVLRPDVELPFDDPELAGCTVGDVLADPERFEGETLADPLEGVDYGRCVAKIMRRADGTPWIHSVRPRPHHLRAEARRRQPCARRWKERRRMTWSRPSPGSPSMPTSTRSSWRSCASWRRSSPASACG